MHERDRQTDGRMDGRTDILYTGPQQRPRLRMASRVKNHSTFRTPADGLE